MPSQKSKIELRGSSWDHTRGYAPLPVTADAYTAQNPDVHITWERRTLRDFAEMSLPDLAKTYDLIVLDHPWLGATEAAGSLLPLDDYLSKSFLDDQAQNSVGESNNSYILHGHQWALPVDAACQVSAYRPDLFEQIDLEIPQSWGDVVQLAGRLRKADAGWVATPLMHVDTFPCFFTLCANAGEQPCQTPDCFVSRQTGIYALDMLRTLAELGPDEALNWNPPQLLDHMSSTSSMIIYSPLLFGYSNYSRAGYRNSLVRFKDIPTIGDGIPHGSILGGAGLAVSAYTSHPEAACDYAAFVASSEIQKSIYFETGGQPGHQQAWVDADVNSVANGFFLNTLTTIGHAALRPRYNGWIAVQDSACQIIHRYLLEKHDPQSVLDELDHIYRDSLNEQYHN
jgi:multiple sugar transport system substrate-binding protein